MYSENFKNLVLALNENGTNYVLLKANESEKIKKYVFLIKDDCYIHILENINLKTYNVSSNDKYWYGASKPKIWLFANGDEVIVYKEIVVRSLTSGIWIPIDKIIQKSAFDNKIKFSVADSVFCYKLCDVDKLIYLLSNAVFTQKKFTNNDISFINNKLSKIDIGNFEIKIGKVFFKYTEKLLEHLKNRDFDKILYDYIRFKEY